MKTGGKNLRHAEAVGRLLEKSLGVGTALSAAIVHQGEVIASAACGSEIEDLYNVGSVSKVYCAAAAAKLVELGLAGWDAPVCGYLPRFSMKDDRYSEITLRMCLNHSSGLPGTGMRMAFTSKWLHEGYYDINYEYLANSKLKAEPGAYSVYCNDGFDVAEMVISALSNMTYTEFLQKYITMPLGVESTCTGENNPGGRFRVRQRGKGVEYLSVIGSGGISTDISDCARFGYAFLQSEGILSADSVAEITKPQGRSLLEGDCASQYGLGWDSVNLQCRGYDFGSRVLGKSGGTSQFLTYLIVIPEYNISAAISGTQDTGVDKLKLICEICAEFLDTQGVSVRTDVTDNLENNKPPVGMDGIYYANRGAFMLSLNEGCLSAQMYSPQGWQAWLTDAWWDGSCFRKGEEAFWFEEKNRSCYLMMKTLVGSVVMAQKISPESSRGMNNTWSRRLGNKYILCNGNPWDTDVYELVNGLTLRAVDDSGSVLFCAYEEGGGFRAMPAMAVNDTETDYMLDGAGGLGSRDTFAPFVYEENGVEYLYDGGVRYRETSTVPLLESGEVVFDGSAENQIFRIHSGWRLEVEENQDVKFIMLDEELRPFYDQRAGGELPLMCSGYMVLLNASPARIHIQVQKTKED